MRSEVWYPIGGFGLLAFLVLGLQSVLTLPFFKNLNPWIHWLFGVLATLLALAAGFYATKDTWIEHLLQWVVDLHPAVPLVAGLGFIALVWYLALGMVPDKFATTALTAGLVVGAFFAPMLAEHALPPGKVADHAASAVSATADFALSQTRGWFG